MRWLNKIPRWWSSVLVIGAVLYLTLYPRPLPDNELQLWEHTDKLVHALMMGAVYFAVALDLRRPMTPRLRFVLAVAVIAFGGAIELAQQAMGLGRTGSLADFAADAAGVFLVSLIF